MYLCFEDDEKRMAFPEHSLVNFDENGFTLKALAGQRDMVFVKLASYQGCVQDFTQALTWIKKKQKTADPGLEIINSAGLSVGQTTRPQPQAQAQQQQAPAARPAQPAAAAVKLPETPSF